MEKVERKKMKRQKTLSCSGILNLFQAIEEIYTAYQKIIAKMVVNDRVRYATKKKGISIYFYIKIILLELKI